MFGFLRRRGASEERLEEMPDALARILGRAACRPASERRVLARLVDSRLRRDLLAIEAGISSRVEILERLRRRRTVQAMEGEANVSALADELMFLFLSALELQSNAAHRRLADTMVRQLMSALASDFKSSTARAEPFFGAGFSSARSTQAILRNAHHGIR
jgi:hypothetical protein